MTCLLLTRNRRHWLRWSLRCTQYQTYPEKEILVVSSGESVSDLLPAGVRHLHLPGHPTTGAMRNAGCEAAAGELIAHFDDDDFSAPGRLADQVARLIESGKAVTGYRTMRFTDGDSWWQYTGVPDYALGTSLVFRRDWWAQHRFPDLRVGEDTAFVYRARALRAITSVDAGDLMWATIHPQNTSPRQLKGNNWRRIH